MAQALFVGGFAIESERIMDKGLAAGLFQGEELTRAQRTRDTAKRKADEDRKALASAGKSLSAAKDGNAAYKIGQLYFSAGKYPEAADAMRKALSLPGLQDPDAAYMEMGIALARSGKKAEAIKAFDAVKDPEFAEVARLWKLRVR
jgi:tetratricopeptide (TPR) repeat protein